MTLIRALAILSLVALVAGGFAPPGDAQASDKILVGASSDDVVRPLLYAVDAGLFKNAGLDVELVKLSNGAAVAAAVAGGSVQLGKGSGAHADPGLREGAAVRRHGEPRKLFVRLAERRACWCSRARRSKRAKDLVGKTIGMVGLNDSNTLGVYAWFEKNGTPIDSVKFIELGNSAGAAALEANRVDANMFLEPALSAALATGNFRILELSE